MMDDIDRTFDWWNSALKGVRGEIDADNPKAGFYRAKAKDKTLSAVAIWYDSNTGELRYQDNGRDVDEMKARERWPYVSRKPITEDVFWHFRDTGVWKDVDDAAQATPEDDAAGGADVLQIAKEIYELNNATEKYKKIESDEQMALAQSLRAKLQEVGGKADKARVAEKEPYLEAGREVDAKYQPAIKMAKAAADRVRTAMQDWNDYKLAQASKVQMQDNAATNVPAPSTQVFGGGGRAAHVGVKDTVTAIDLDKAFAQFREDPLVMDLFTNLAQKAVNAGIAVPGATIEKRSAIR